MYSYPIGPNCTAAMSTNTSVFFYYTTYCSALAATAIPTTAPSGPSNKPTTQPSAVPTKSPTPLAPTATPSSFKPTTRPSVAPSKSPTALPTFDAYYFNFGAMPSLAPTATRSPALPPATRAPTKSPKPTPAPTIQDAPVIAFTSQVTIAGITPANINPATQTAIVVASAQSMGVKPSNVSRHTTCFATVLSLFCTFPFDVVCAAVRSFCAHRLGACNIQQDICPSDLSVWLRSTTLIFSHCGVAIS